MHSLEKSEKLLQKQEDEIWDDIVKREQFLYYALIFLNGSIMWAYYSCLSALNFCQAAFPDSGLDFSFLTTPVTPWPMFLGQSVQMAFGLDKKIRQQTRGYVGYGIYLVMALLVMVVSAINFGSQKTGATLVLVCFACSGAANSLAEALAALFPVEKFTNAVQVGNVWVAILNITIQTLLRFTIGGTRQTGDSTSTSFYLFFSLLVVVLIAAVMLYRHIVTFPCVKYLIERNESSALAEGFHPQSIRKTLGNITRIFKIIWLPALTQFLALFISFVTIPGFGCTAARNVAVPLYSDEAYPMVALWYCSPGIIGSYNLGDFLGRVFCSVLAYKLFTMRLSFGLSISRFVVGALVYDAALNFAIGLSNGVLCTVTMGAAPRLLKPEDRETGGAILVWWLFIGIAGSSTLGFVISDQHWFGL